MVKKVIAEKRRKIILLTVTAIILIAVIALTRYQHTSPIRLSDNWKGKKIEQFHSLADKDGDGIDDQKDILQGALDYVNTMPKYKSKYYSSGYPDDKYGVCTDVVAFAMKAAGYDFMDMISNDNEIHTDEYDIDKPDRNIDFRRVKNLYLFFKNNAENLTTDVSDINEWRGGDIVVFKSHIGIVSDRRNKNGVPYIIHHNDPWQISYEQDILEKRDDIIGHYRWINDK